MTAIVSALAKQKVLYQEEEGKYELYKNFHGKRALVKHVLQSDSEWRVKKTHIAEYETDFRKQEAMLYRTVLINSTYPLLTKNRLQVYMVE